MSNYISMSSYWSEIVDCRMIQLELFCYQLSQSDVKNVAEYCYRKTGELLDNKFFTYCNYGDKYIESGSLNKKILKSIGCIDWGFEGDVIGDTVYNNKSFRAYDNKLLYDTIATPKTTEISIDYNEYFNQHFSGINTPEEYKSAMLKIFNEDGRKKMALWRKHDIAGSFSTFPYHSFPDVYRVEYSIQVAIQCLGNAASDFADGLAGILLGMANMISNISGHVTLSPISWPASSTGQLRYFGYYGSKNNRDTAHIKAGYWNLEWYPYYYLSGAEWFNIISPLQMEHLPNIENEIRKDSHIYIRRMAKGGMAVNIDKRIESIDVRDLSRMKKLLYNALYPGCRKIEFKHLNDPNNISYFGKPRLEWEYAPVFDDEIEVTNDGIVFKHKNCDI